jgi:hypothetical protein
MQHTCVKNNIIENIIVCEPEMLPTLNLPYDNFIEWKIWHEIDVYIVQGEYFKDTKDADGNVTETRKYNIETEQWDLIEEIIEEVIEE